MIIFFSIGMAELINKKNTFFQYQNADIKLSTNRRIFSLEFWHLQIKKFIFTLKKFL